MRAKTRAMPWTATESIVIERIIDRAIFMFPDRERQDVFMDITATIMGGCRLRLDDWLASDDENFTHDLVGIELHLNRQTFRLGDCFLPRFATPRVEVFK
jgi:hypothetical protein